MLVVDQIDGLPEADDVCFIRCNHCYAQGPARGEEQDAIDEWNERTGHDWDNQWYAMVKDLSKALDRRDAEIAWLRMQVPQEELQPDPFRYRGGDA